jgi:creatinine amidohydrolase
MHWEELTGDEFPAAVARSEGVCLLPLSCIERHAHHLPLGTDMYIGRDLCRRAAALEPAVIFPDFVFTQIAEARHCPGTIAIDPDLILRMLDNLCREIARNGFSKIALVNAHGGNIQMLSFFAQQQLIGRRDYVVYNVNRPLLPEDEAAVAAQWESEVDGHAGEAETSQIMAIRPDLVRTDQLRDDDEGQPQGRLRQLYDAGVFSGMWWYGDHPTHYRGNGSRATQAKGELAMAAEARSLAAAIRLIKDDRETPRLQAEFFAAHQHGRS